MSDFEELLRKSLEARESKPLEAVNDLNAIVAELSRAVSSVTKDRLRLFLDPLKPKPTHGPTFAVVLRFSDDEDRILRVVMVWDEIGYPANIWRTYEGWDQGDVREQANTSEELRIYLRNLVSSPTSELVRLIANELAVAEAGTEAALAG